MSQIQTLRTYIEEEVSEKDKVTLVDVIARFDFHQHAIPTLNQIRQAVKGTKGLQIERKGGTIILARTKSKNRGTSEIIQESDMESAYSLYTEKL